MVTESGIEVNPEKVKVIQTMSSLGNFYEDEEYKKAFEELKKYLAELPILAKPVPGEQLYVYLSPTEAAIRGGRKTRFGFVLNGSEIKVILLISPSYGPHQQLSREQNDSCSYLRRLLEWTTELREYNIRYGPRTTIKAQVLTDFLAESLHVEVKDLWKLVVRLNYRASNNEPEYEAFLADLKAAQQVGAAQVHIFSDLQLVAQQLNGSYDIKNEKLVEYVKAMEAAKELFTELSFKKIHREENKKTNILAKISNSLHSWKSREVMV
ncbi:uncharacterized protein [Primulina eburnea]|uniref:uncharacterized protein n=1 Tax=Primulina eburnea TaxID=1245227 RepID=UPI003C6C0B17